MFTSSFLILELLSSLYFFMRYRRLQIATFRLMLSLINVVAAWQHRFVEWYDHWRTSNVSLADWAISGGPFSLLRKKTQFYLDRITSYDGEPCSTYQESQWCRIQSVYNYYFITNIIWPLLLSATIILSEVSLKRVSLALSSNFVYKCSCRFLVGILRKAFQKPILKLNNVCVW